MFKGTMPKSQQIKKDRVNKVHRKDTKEQWAGAKFFFLDRSTLVTKEGDEVVTKVEMPEVPGVDQVLEAAEKVWDLP